MIKAGYCLEIRSWENDGDFYQTVKLDGLTFEQATWYNRFMAKLHNMASNSYIENETLIGMYEYASNTSEFGAKPLGPLSEDNDLVSEDDYVDAAWSVVYDLGLASVEQPGEKFVRVIEKVELYFFPVDILPLVTVDLKKN